MEIRADVWSAPLDQMPGKLLAEGTAQQLIARAGVQRLEDAFLKLSEVQP